MTLTKNLNESMVVLIAIIVGGYALTIRGVWPNLVAPPGLSAEARWLRL